MSRTHPAAITGKRIARLRTRLAHLAYLRAGCRKRGAMIEHDELAQIEREKRDELDRLEREYDSFTPEHRAIADTAIARYAHQVAERIAKYGE